MSADAYAEIQVEDRDTSEKRRDEAAGQAESGTAEQNEKFIKRGSELKLRCYLRKATEAPAYIFWFHNQATDTNIHVQENGTSPLVCSKV